MTFFESLLALLAVAILLLQVSRRLTIPYPTMLAAAGVVIGLVPGTPKIDLDPHTALALFIAPVLVLIAVIAWSAYWFYAASRRTFFAAEADAAVREVLHDWPRLSKEARQCSLEVFDSVRNLRRILGF